MPTDPFLPEGRDFPRTRSPDNSGGHERKRRRKVLSCYDCRRRKLQCDRTLPACGRCTKAGQAANCLYLEDATETPVRDEHVPQTSAAGKLPPFYGSSSHTTGPSAPTGDLLSRLEFQDGRIKQLEAALARAGGQSGALTSRLPPTPESIAYATDAAPVQDRETTLLRGRSFKTQFHGNTHPGALIARIPELHIFTRDAFEEFPALSRVKEGMSGLDKRTDYAGANSQHRAVSDEELRLLLPTKTEADALLELYFDSYGTIYHVLHMPTFWQEYNDMYSGAGNASPYFVALVLVMTAASRCLTTTSLWLYRANSSKPREKAVEFITAVDYWLMSQSQKHVTAYDFQLRVLLLVAKQVIARKAKRTWTESGDVLRFCMAAGLHRTPDLIRKDTSILDKELRLRIWAAVVELELQASFDRGMISASWPLQSDCPAPHNLNDDDLDAKIEHLPALRRSSDFTSSSYLCVASESMKLRTTLNTYLNNIRQTISFEDAKHFTDEIENHLQSIPEWSSRSSEIVTVLLSLNLRQYMLVLHDRQIRNADTKAERDFSRMILVETAARMIQAHKSLTEKGCYALELLCYDQLRAALSTIHIIAAADPHADDALARAIEDTAHRIVPDAIEMLTNKVMRFGREHRQLWILGAAYGYARTKRDPTKRSLYMQEAVETVTESYHKIMASQEESISVHANGSNEVSTLSAKDSSLLENMLPPTPMGTGMDMTSTNMVPDPVTLDMDEIAAWTFEDWNFNPSDIAAMFADNAFAQAQ